MGCSLGDGQSQVNHLALWSSCLGEGCGALDITRGYDQKAQGVWVLTEKAPGESPAVPISITQHWELWFRASRFVSSFPMEKLLNPALNVYVKKGSKLAMLLGSHFRKLCKLSWKSYSRCLAPSFLSWPTACHPLQHSGPGEFFAESNHYSSLMGTPKGLLTAVQDSPALVE